MHEFSAHTLVDITLNGKLQRPFPFESDSGEMIQDKESLLLAKSQNSNFNTLLQLLQIRGNIVYENGPMKIEQTLGNTAFGDYYDGKHASWHFKFFVEQSSVYGDDIDPTGQLVEDFNLVPILKGCKETANFPIATFITKNLTGHTNNPITNKQKVIGALTGNIINTYFSYIGQTDK